MKRGVVSWWGLDGLRYNGCALVDDAGHIMANISVADVRGLVDVAHNAAEADATLDTLAVS